MATASSGGTYILAAPHPGKLTDMCDGLLVCVNVQSERISTRRASLRVRRSPERSGDRFYPFTKPAVRPSIFKGVHALNRSLRRERQSPPAGAHGDLGIGI